MAFQIQALDPQPFAALFAMSDADLAQANARRVIVTAHPGAPCRVSLSDAAVGDTVVLTHFTHQPAASPFRSSHAIFVRQGATQAQPQPNEVPDMLLIRLISLRGFDAQDMMVSADVVDGQNLAPAIDHAFCNPAIAYIHLHIAKQGCFAASVVRA